MGRNRAEERVVRMLREKGGDRQREEERYTHTYTEGERRQRKEKGIEERKGERERE